MVILTKKKNSFRTKIKYNFKSKKNDSRTKSKAKSNFSSKREKFNKTRKMYGGFLPKFFKNWGKNKVKPEPPKRPSQTLETITLLKPPEYSHLSTYNPQSKIPVQNIYSKLSSSPLPVYPQRTLSFKAAPQLKTKFAANKPIPEDEQLRLTLEKITTGNIYSQPETEKMGNQNIYSKNKSAKFVSNGEIFEVPMATNNINIFSGKISADFLSSNGKTYNVPMENPNINRFGAVKNRIGAVTKKPNSIIKSDNYSAEVLSPNGQKFIVPMEPSRNKQLTLLPEEPITESLENALKRYKHHKLKT